MPDDVRVTEPEVLSASVTTPAPATLTSPAERLLAGVRDLVIDSDAVYEAAAEDLRAAKTMKKRLDDERKELTRPLDEVKAKIMDKYRPALAICEQVIDVVQPKMIGYDEKKRKEAEAERQRQEAIARAERERLAREAEDARRKAEAEAAETRRKAQEEADALAAAGREEEAARARQEAERRALEVRAEGETQARALEQTAMVVEAAPAAVERPKAAGTAIAGTWKARVTDPRALRKFVGENPMYDNLLVENETALNAQARALGKNFSIPGVEPYLDQTIRSRSR